MEEVLHFSGTHFCLRELERDGTPRRALRASQPPAGGVRITLEQRESLREKSGDSEDLVRLVRRQAPFFPAARECSWCKADVLRDLQRRHGEVPLKKLQDSEREPTLHGTHEPGGIEASESE